MEKEYIRVDVLLVGFVMALIVVAGLAFSTRKQEAQLSCYQKLAEQDIVAKIATSTGKLPGNPTRDPIGTTYKVNVDYCKGK